MADMYGAIRSNVFKVKDVEAFTQWFEANVRFGYEIEVWGDAEGVAFGAHEQYPNAYPMTVPSEDDDENGEWDLEAFAVEVRKHLLPGEEFRVLAAGNEKLRYVAATHLIITHNKVDFVNLCEGN